MDLRKKLLEKIREQQFVAPDYPPVFVRNLPGHATGQSQMGSPNAAASNGRVNVCNELVWKIVDQCRDQLQGLASGMTDDEENANRSPPSPDYTARWNCAVWPLIDATILLSSSFPVTAENQFQEAGDGNRYALRREVQQLLSLADLTSPIRRLPQSDVVSNDITGVLYQHYRAAADQLSQLGVVAASGGLVEEQLVQVLRQYRATAASFCNQTLPQALSAEAVRVRSLEQQRHSSSPSIAAQSPPATPSVENGAKATSVKLSEHLTEFRNLLDWCFALVGTLLNNTMEILNQTYLYTETNRYFVIMRNELRGIAPAAVMGLCRFLLWVSNQPPMIMVTKTEFASHCVLLNNYFVNKDHLHMQIVAESTAQDIQQKCFLKHTELIGRSAETNFASAGVLVMKKFDASTANSMPNATVLRRTLSTSCKRRRRSRAQPASTPASAVSSPPSGTFGNEEDDSSGVLNTPFNVLPQNGHAQNGENYFNFPTSSGFFGNDSVAAAPVGTQDRLDISWRFDTSTGLVIAEAEQACCTDRNLTNEMPLGSNGNQPSSADRQRDIYYLHCWTKIAVFGTWYNVHTLSLPFVIPTRKNQDLQLHRMLKSYSATIFWLHVAGKQDGFLIDWCDTMAWPQFSRALNIYFTREARVSRGLSEFDFMFLKEKAKCFDCATDSNADLLSYQNIICPHLFYQCGEKTLLKHSLWRALLDLIQLFQNERTKVRELWDRGVLGGLWSMDSVTKILARHTNSVLMARISLLSGGSIVLSFHSMNTYESSNGHSAVMHTEPLDQHQLSRRNLVDCMSDIAQSESVDYLLDCNLQPILPSTLLTGCDSASNVQPLVYVKANSDQLGCPNTHRQYAFHALKLSIVVCKNGLEGREIGSATKKRNYDNMQIATADNADANQRSFETEFKNLVRRYGYTQSDVTEAIQQLEQSDVHDHF